MSGGVGFGPAGEILLQSGDGKLGARLPIGRKKPSRIRQHGFERSGGEDAGGRLTVFLRRTHRVHNGTGPILGRGRSGSLEVASNAWIVLPAGHGQKVGNAWLTARQRRGGSNHAPQRFLIGFVGGCPGGAAIERRADGNRQLPLRDVLMDGVVGKAGERLGDAVDLHFGFVRLAQF